MKSTEKKEVRMRMVDMHEFFINKINASINNENFIEASWLIYSCIENRFFRILQKYKNQCKYSNGKCKKNKNELAISTKLSCVERLVENNVSCISSSFSLKQLKEIRLWIKKRNDMMRDLLSLETYKNMDEDFKTLAIEGEEILRGLYNSCTNFRSKFYSEEYTFVFPEKAMEACPCNKNNHSKEVN